MENKKSNIVLWVGLAIPVVALIVVAILAYMPSNLVAKYDFLYYSRNYSTYCGGIEVNTYKVKDQKVLAVTKSDLPTDLPKNSSCYNIDSDLPKIYRYNVTTNERTQISLADAQKLGIDNSPVSPDNISIQRGDYYNNGIFELFGGNNHNYNTWYFKNDKDELRKIDLGTTVTDSYNFVFIGWVLK